MFADVRLVRRALTLGVVVMVCLARPAASAAQAKPAESLPPAATAPQSTSVMRASALQTLPKTTDYDELYLRYLEAARTTKPASNWMADLLSDARARRVNDLVTVRVVESLSATGSSDAHIDKASKADGLLQPPLAKPLSKILPTNSTTKFVGSGGASRATDMTATLTARVTEVLPNGDLVVEGIREIEINGDRQVVVLSGVVRVADVSTDNAVLSSAVGQLQIRLLGRGLVKDSLTPGWLIRMLNKVF